MSEPRLEPLDPSTACEMYLKDREQEVSQGTLNAHRSRLRLFVQWCDENGIDNLNDLTGRMIHEFKLWRQDGLKVDGISQETLYSSMATLRVFLNWAVGVDAVDPRVPEKVVLPSRTSRATRDEMLDVDHTEDLLAHLEKYQYASDAHLILHLLWETGMRVGALLALDVEDFDPEDQSLSLKHRPDTGTPIKNGQSGERMIALTEKTCQLIVDYLDETRIETEDEHGRHPLITTEHGRRVQQSLRNLCYYWTSPCRIGECPHEREPDECEATRWANAAKCPSSVSTHPIRRGSITHHLRNDVPVPIVSDRMDVSPDVLEKHYDERTEEEKMEQRRDYLDNI